MSASARVPRASETPRQPGSLAARGLAEVRPHARLVAAVAVVAGAWAVWVSGPGWATPAFVVASISGAALGVIDARTQRLPNVIVYPALVAVAALLLVAAAATGEWDRMGRALVGGAALGGSYLAINLIDQDGRSLGLGDAKLAVVLGMVAGWMSVQTVVLTGVLPFLIGAAIAIVLIATQRGGRGTMLAFGPYMLIGAVAAGIWYRLSG